MGSHHRRRPGRCPAPTTAWPGEPWPGPGERAALLDWLAGCTQHLLDALREAGPDRACWAWWEELQATRTSGAAARHQLQEIAVHTYDAQLAAGDAQPLPAQVAIDGIEDFQVTCVATATPWPHEPVIVDYHATEGRSWRLTLSAAGAHTTRLDDKDTHAEGEAGVAATASASDLELFVYGRLPLESVKVDGDHRHFERLIEWDPQRLRLGTWGRSAEHAPHLAQHPR